MRSEFMPTNGHVGSCHTQPAPMDTSDPPATPTNSPNVLITSNLTTTGASRLPPQRSTKIAFRGRGHMPLRAGDGSESARSPNAHHGKPATHPPIAAACPLCVMPTTLCRFARLFVMALNLRHGNFAKCRLIIASARKPSGPAVVLPVGSTFSSPVFAM